MVICTEDDPRIEGLLRRLWDDALNRYQRNGAVFASATVPYRLAVDTFQEVAGVLLGAPSTAWTDDELEDVRWNATTLATQHATRFWRWIKNEESSIPAMVMGLESGYAEKWESLLNKRREDAQVTNERRLQAFLATNRCTIADVCTSALVYRPDMNKWRKDKLNPKSVMSVRIEEVLHQRRKLKKP